MKNIRVFLSENFQLLEVKFSIYLNRRVFVMLAKLMKKSCKEHRDKQVFIVSTFLLISITETHLFKYTENFTTQK